MRVERTFAWEDEFKRLLLRFARIQQRHYGMKLMAYTLINLRAFCGVENSQPVSGDCSRATGFIQPVHDGVMQGFVDGLQLGLHATYPMQDAHGSALASVPDRHSFASCDSAGCPAPPHSRWRAAVCRQETSGPFPK